ETIKLASKTSLAPETKSKSEATPVSGQTAQAPVLSPVKTTSAQEYTIKAGDTLIKLAEEYYGSPAKWERIYAANKDGIKDPNYIFIGQKIILPPAESQPGT
ncbi:MAG: LysM peptidoglycan-binding domain-containing protein, partial [Candidatus Binatia bacterium]